MFLTELGFASCQIRVRLSLEHVVSYRRDISVVRAHGFNFHDSSNLLKFSSCRTLGRRNSHSADVCLFFLNDQSDEVERGISRPILKTFLLRQAGSFPLLRSQSRQMCRGHILALTTTTTTTRSNADTTRSNSANGGVRMVDTLCSSSHYGTFTYSL